MVGILVGEWRPNKTFRFYGYGYGEGHRLAAAGLHARDFGRDQLSTQGTWYCCVITCSAALLVGTKIPSIMAALRPTSLFMKLPITVIEGMTDVVQLPRLSPGPRHLHCRNCSCLAVRIRVLEPQAVRRPG